MYSRQKNVKGAISCYEKDLNLITYPIHNSTYTVISDNTGNISDSARTDVSTDATEITNTTDTDNESAGTSNPLTPSQKIKLTSIHLKLGSLYSSPPLMDVISAAFHYDTGYFSLLMPYWL
jgi:transglutaminase/protease-like cytokinesis protein 3